jgi:hypothetical protein
MQLYSCIQYKLLFVLREKYSINKTQIFCYYYFLVIIVCQRIQQIIIRRKLSYAS